jgi:hypothetical protein
MEEKKWIPLGKKHDFTERRKGDLVYKLIVIDNNKPIDKFYWNTSKKFKEILELLKLKYGLDYK